MAASAGGQGSDFAFLAVIISRLVPTEILAAFLACSWLQTSSEAPSFNDVVGMMRESWRRWSGYKAMIPSSLLLSKMI